MTKNLLFVLVSLIAACFTGQAFARNIYIYKTNGTVPERTLVNARCITFGSGQMNVLLENGTAEATDLTSFNYLSFYEKEMPTAIETSQSEGTKIYFDGNYVIVQSEETVQSVEIYSMLGVRLAQNKTDSKFVKLSLKSLPDGIYFVKAQVGEQIVTQKILKK